MARVLIGAAHTLENPGEVYGDLREADLTRKILTKTLPHLARLNIPYKDVPLDLPLTDRINWINATGFSKDNGDIFVEIHVNDGGKTGVESWFRGNSTADNGSQRLAESVLKHLCAKTGFANNGARSEYDHEMTSLLILNQTNTISTAIEILYIDNPSDIAILKDESRLENIGKALAESIDEYLKEVKINPIPNNKIIPSKKPGFNPMAANNDIDPFGFNPGSALPSPIYNPQPSTFAPKNTFGGSNPPMPMDREQRKSVVKATYQKILGREPTTQEMNTNLNTAVTEADLTKKLLESDEFKKMVEKAQKFEGLETEVKRLKTELDSAKQIALDAERTTQNITSAQKFKDEEIKKLTTLLAQKGIIPRGQSADTLNNGKKEKNLPSSGILPPKRGGIVDLLIKIFKI